MKRTNTSPRAARSKAIDIGFDDGSKFLPPVSRRKQPRSPEDKTNFANRLSRISGQIQGIKGMIDRDLHCTDILVQCSAVSAAVSSLERELLAEYIRTKVASGIREDRPDAVSELMWTLRRLMK